MARATLPAQRGWEHLFILVSFIFKGMWAEYGIAMRTSAHLLLCKWCCLLVWRVALWLQCSKMVVHQNTCIVCVPVYVRLGLAWFGCITLPYGTVWHGTDHTVRHAMVWYSTTRYELHARMYEELSEQTVLLLIIAIAIIIAIMNNSYCYNNSYC